MKKIVFLLSGLAAIPLVLAESQVATKYSHMMTNYGVFGFLLYKLLFIAGGAFLFSAVFWLTYRWLVVGDLKCCSSKAKSKRRR
ncbi:MAG: hypothetical protein ABIG89_02040 [Candidatus Woesearchaeota archaeon]